jgi:hypothetical protein
MVTRVLLRTAPYSHNYAALRSFGDRKSSGQLRPPIQRIRALAALRLCELGRNREGLGLCEAINSGALPASRLPAISICETPENSSSGWPSFMGALHQNRIQLETRAFRWTRSLPTKCQCSTVRSRKKAKAPGLARPGPSLSGTNYSPPDRSSCVKSPNFRLRVP